MSTKIQTIEVIVTAKLTFLKVFEFNVIILEFFYILEQKDIFVLIDFVTLFALFGYDLRVIVRL